MGYGRRKFIDTGHFVGGGKLEGKSADDGHLSGVMRAMLVREAALIINGSSTADFTLDSSGGTAGMSFTAEADDEIFTLVGCTLGASTGTGPVRLVESGGLPTGVDDATDYYIIRLSSTTFRLATSYANALKGTYVSISTDGTPPNYVDAIGKTPAVTEQSLTSGATTAILGTGTNGVDDVALTVLDAYAELMDKVNEHRTDLGLPTAALTGATAPNDTVDAIDDTGAANTLDTDAVTYATAKAIFTELLNAQRTVFMGVNDLRVAVGLAPMIDLGAEGTELAGGDFAALTAAADGADLSSTVLLTEVDAFVDCLSDNFATMVDGWQDVQAGSLGVTLGGFVAG